MELDVVDKELLNLVVIAATLFRQATMLKAEGNQLGLQAPETIVAAANEGNEDSLHIDVTEDFDPTGNICTQKGHMMREMKWSIARRQTELVVGRTSTGARTPTATHTNYAFRVGSG